MTVEIFPGKAQGRVSVPPSKSYAHRYMLAAALAEGESVLHGIAESDDLAATADCLTVLGATVRRQGSELFVRGAEPLSVGALYPCRESGSTLRFLIPAVLSRRSVAHFTGSARLMERGIGVYAELFAKRGISVLREKDAITVNGSLRAGEFILPGNVSSQYISGLLFALPLLTGDSTLRVLPPIESRPYLAVTLNVLRQFGITVTENDGCYEIPGGQCYRAGEYTVEGDWSNAAPFLALRYFGGRLTVDGLRDDSLQGDALCLSCFDKLNAGFAALDLRDVPDLAPILFAFAAAKHGGTFTGTGRLSLKESDRAAVMASELSKCGISCTVTADSVTVHPGHFHEPGEPFFGHGDHRIVMALSILCTLVGGEIIGCEAVNKSFPDYFRALTAAGISLSYKETDR